MFKIDELLINLLQSNDEKIVPGVAEPNYVKMPAFRLSPTAENAVTFNRLYKALKEDPEFFRIKRTISGGICLHHIKFPCWDYQVLTTKTGAFKGVELTVITSTLMQRIQFAPIPQSTLSGKKAWFIFRQVCKKFKVDVDEFQIDSASGKAIKDTIPQPMIGLDRKIYVNNEYTNVHHIDFHSSYPTGLINTHPEFTEPISYMYERRHTNPVFKDVLNFSIGFMQSSHSQYRFAHLSHDAIVDNVNRLKDISARLIAAGRVPLMYNTDGVWYLGDMYHDENEGEGLGKWENDHVNCKFRAKSNGAYEYIEDGKYHPVVRGRTLYDSIKAREDWEWGDIYRKDCRPIIFEWNEEEGIKYA